MASSSRRRSARAPRLRRRAAARRPRPAPTGAKAAGARAAPIAELDCRRRRLQCVSASTGAVVDSSQCAATASPATSRACPSQPACPTVWVESGFGACTKSCGQSTKTQSNTHTSHVRCVCHLPGLRSLLTLFISFLFCFVLPRFSCRWRCADADRDVHADAERRARPRGRECLHGHAADLAARLQRRCVRGRTVGVRRILRMLQDGQWTKLSILRCSQRAQCTCALTSAAR